MKAQGLVPKHLAMIYNTFYSVGNAGEGEKLNEMDHVPAKNLHVMIGERKEWSVVGSFGCTRAAQLDDIVSEKKHSFKLRASCSSAVAHASTQCMIYCITSWDGFIEVRIYQH